MAENRGPENRTPEDSLLAGALAEHDRRQLAALEEGPGIGGGDGESKAQKFLDECRGRLRELKEESSPGK